LRRDAERALHMFQDPKESAIVLVTLPEEMPTTETIELATALTSELHMPIAKVVVNCMLPPLFSADERAQILAAPAAPGPLLSVVHAAKDRATRETVQAESMKRLSKELPLSPSFLPFLFTDAATKDAVHKLSLRLT
jgi:anion-transporting  ArsA/GET3 family ATPase